MFSTWDGRVTVGVLALSLSLSLIACQRNTPTADHASPAPATPAAVTQTVETHFGPIALQSGYPAEASVQKLYDELDFQRAVQAYIWATPLVSREALRVANKRDWGVDFNMVSIIDNYTTPAVKVLAGNNTTIYAGAWHALSALSTRRRPTASPCRSAASASPLSRSGAASAPSARTPAPC